MPETVELDRAAVVDLLVEIHAVTDVLEAITGTGPLRIYKGVELAAARIYEQVIPDDYATHEIFYDAADTKAREIVNWLSKPKEEASV